MRVAIMASGLSAWLAISGCARLPPPHVAHRERGEAALAAASLSSPDGPLSLPSLSQRIGTSRLVCIGEQHDDPRHHEVQHALFEVASLAAERAGASLALGFEMVARGWQSSLDDHRRGQLDDPGLERALEWDRRWGFDFAMYGPLFHSAHEQKVVTIALNAPKELTKAVARGGLEGLPAEVRASLPELDLENDDHRRFFWTAMGFEGEAAPPAHGGHGAHAGGAERFYSAQVIWDETMAESAAAWLQEPERRIVVIAGNGHCHRSAIVDRVVRRVDGLTSLSVLLQTGDVDLPPHAVSDVVVRLAEASP